MKPKSSGAGAMFLKRRAPEPELCLCDPEIIHTVPGHIDHPE